MFDPSSNQAWQQACAGLGAAEPGQRMAALDAFEALGSREAIPLLVDCLKHDPDEGVRRRAAEVSRRLADPARDNPRDPYGQFRI